MRRRLLDVGKKVSGVVGALRDEGDTPPSQPDPAPEPAPVSEEDSVPTETAPTSAPAAELDPRCAEAVELARAAAVEVGGSAVGEHLGAEADDERVVTHSFASTDPAYVGWRWAVTVARAEGVDEVTVDEVVLLPGAGALLAPAWVPWSERVQPGDLSPGDLLPPKEDDHRLVPSYADVDAERLPFDLHRELGLGRPRVLSREGRLEAAERWYEGEPGPSSPLAKAAPAQCGTCGFLTPLAGALGHVFGVCANALAPDDGRVVAWTHGCGAHSEIRLDAPEPATPLAVEHEELEIVSTADVPEDATVPGQDDPPLDDVPEDV